MDDNSSSGVGIPPSILDTDLYKLTMQQAVLHHFPDVQATYQFTHRDKGVYFTRKVVNRFISAVSQFSRLSLTYPERLWLEKTCPFFTQRYLNYLSAYRFNPEQVHIAFDPVSPDGELGHVRMEATGPWAETIFWEVPLMSCLSELYFTNVDTDWSYEGQEEIAYQKGKSLLEAGCAFSEFGTRRRRSFYLQDLVVRSLLRAQHDTSGGGKLIGTSNAHLAHKHNIEPIGTIAHEWFMGVAALKGYENANSLSMDYWEEVYPNIPLVALTDTFSTEAFFKNFTANHARSERWQTLRQDSGDPYAFAPRAKEVYESLGINYRTKSIIYSDALNMDKALGLKKQCDELGFPVSFGIGTFLTNDFRTLSSGGAEKSKALNMVIKIASVDGKPCVKISDDLSKNTGDQTTVDLVKKIFGLPQ